MRFSRQLLRGCTFLLLSCSLLAQPQDLAQKSHHAKELMAAGKFAEAIPLYRDLVRALPNNPGLIMNLGLALDMAGHKREAVREFEAVLKLNPLHVQALLLLGTTYLDLGEPSKALGALEKAVQAQPHNLTAQGALAEALLSLGRLEEAARCFQSLSEQDSEKPKVWYGLGLSYEGLAQRNFEELEKVALGSAYWLHLVGEARLKVQQYSSAFYFYRQALAKMPSMRGIHATLGEIYKSTGHPEWAAIEEEKERKMPPLDCSGGLSQPGRSDPQPTDLSTQKLECNFLAGRYRELIAAAKDARTTESYYWWTRAYNQLALEAFSRLGQLPPSAEMHELIAKLESNRGQYAESAKEWQEALKLSPGNPTIETGLAIALFQSGNLQGARALLRDLLKREPDSAELNYMLGDTVLRLQRPEEAIPLLKRAIANDPHLLAAHGSLARAYLQLGQAERAIPHLKAALPLDEDGSLHYQLGRAYQARGEPDLAREMLKKYQEIHNAEEAANKTVEKEVEITPP